MKKVRVLTRWLAFFTTGLAVLSLFLSCAETRSAADAEPPGVSGDVLSRVADKRVYFAHQSVGYNILAGIEYYAGDRLSLRDLSSEERGSFPRGPVFAHSTIGENTKPLEKISDFAYRIEHGIGDAADIAALKFCYVDFSRDTDPAALFGAYASAIERLQGEYPGLAFMHFTVPLTVTGSGLKNRIKVLLGRAPEGAAENLVRQEYNEMIRAAYPGAVFDIARLESTRRDGTRAEGSIGGKKYYSLLDSYSTDGGHLNEYASRLAAGEFLHFISKIDH